jgi:hypothetical protein
MAKSSKKSRPSKPHPDFPLFPHATGRWAKKVRSKLHYFGKIEGDPKGQVALARWIDQKDDLLAGRAPRAQREGLTIDELCNRFLHHKQGRVETGELTETTWGGYQISCRRIKRHFGANRLVEDLTPSDLERYRDELAKTNGLVGLRNQVRNARMVLGYAYKAALIDRPLRFGPGFSQPTQKAIRRQRKPRMSESDALLDILDNANPLTRIIHQCWATSRKSFSSREVQRSYLEHRAEAGNY